MDSTVSKFRAVWRGARKDAYGTFRLDGTKKGPKVGGKALTLRESVTDEHFEDHLNGSAPIGLIPISPPDQSQWGVIDVDDYSFDHEAFRKLVGRSRIPVVHCRSKSGGAHLYFFLDAPAPARDLRQELERIAAELGHRGSEIFPKQPNVKSDEVGNWINLPYADHERTVRYAISHETGESIDLDEFCDLVEKRRLTLDQLRTVTVISEDLKSSDNGHEDLFVSGPPCLPAIAANGVPEGLRNATLYNVGMYLKKRFPKDWHEKLATYNDTIMQPPLSEKEVHVLARSCAKGTNFTCKSEPLKSHCQSRLCSTRKFGVGEGGDFEFPAIQSLQKVGTEPPTYFMRIEGHEEARLELRSDDMMSFRAFRKRVFEQLNWYPPGLTPKMFEEIMRMATDKMQEIPMAAEESLYAGAKGALFLLLRAYLVDRTPSEDVDELIAGNPVTVDEGKTICFTYEGFKGYLKKNHFRELRDSEIFVAFKTSKAINDGRVRTSVGHPRVFTIVRTDLEDAAQLLMKAELHAD